MGNLIKENRDTTRLAHEALTMALAILAERITSLPKEDRDDLYELVKELGTAEEPEDIEGVLVTMREILDQAPVRITALNEGWDKPRLGLRRWVDFVSRKIRDVRERAGLTQDELAAKSGLPQSHISRLENAQHSPSRVTLEKLAAALGIEAREFDPSDE